MKSSHSQSRRRGLSTLELVMALPILLMVMALMVNYGVVACWKVRGLSVARNALWSTRWPRSGASNPRPGYWPQSAGVGTGGAGNVAELDDPRVYQPVARGPMVGAEVNADLLDPTRGLRRGSATLTRGYAMLSKMGSFQIEANTLMLDGRWQYPQMGLSSSWRRRIPVIYLLQTAPPNLVTSYVQAVVAIYYASFQEALRPLDNDEEYIYYGQLFGWGGAPDFHPRLNRFCSLDRSLADERVEDLIDRIQGRDDPRVSSLAERMARAFIGLYERVIREYETLLGADPPPSAAQRAAMQAEIGQLRQKIDTLNQFMQTFQN